MALNIIINKVSVAASFAAGATVATAVASGGRRWPNLKTTTYK